MSPFIDPCTFKKIVFVYPKKSTYDGMVELIPKEVRNTAWRVWGAICGSVWMASGMGTGAAGLGATWESGWVA